MTLPVLHIAILALIQGITEFLPISSSGHLVLTPVLLGWPDQGLTIDVAVHVGTLGAVMLYFWRDMALMVGGVIQMAKRRRVNDGGRLLLLLVLATVPVVIAGSAFNHYWPDGLRSVTLIGWTTLGFGVVLWLADRLGMTMRRIEHLRIFDVLIIGLSQVLSLLPGTSRSGITMSAARLLGMERSEAARFSMLMSIPAIMGAGVLKGLELYESKDQILTSAALMAAAMSFVAALITIAFLMAWLRRATFTPFVVYRIILGGGLLALSYGWFV